MIRLQDATLSLASNRRRTMARGLLLASCSAGLFAVPVAAQDTVVNSGETVSSQINMDDSDTLTVADGGTVSVGTNAVNVNCSTPCADVQITNSGDILGGSRGINSFVNVGGGAIVDRNITIINTSTGLIEGGANGIRLQTGSNGNPATGSVISISNAGTIRTTDTNNQPGISLVNLDGATILVENLAGGLIEGPIGIQINTAASVTNSGTITGQGFNSTGEAIRLTGGGVNTITLASGSVTSAGVGGSSQGRAVQFTGSGSNTLNVETGAVINGELWANGGGVDDTLNLTGSGSDTLVTTFGFDRLNVQGGDWSINESINADLGGTVSSGASLTFLDSSGGTGGGFVKGAVVNDGTLVFGRTGFVSQNNGGTDMVISGSGDIRVINGGAFLMTVANSYTGDTIIENGQLRGDAADVFSVASHVEVQADGLLNLNDFNQEIAGLSGAGTVRLGNGSGDTLLTLGSGDADTLFSGTVQQLGHIRKIGSGAQSFSTGNGFEGTVSIDEGTIALVDAGTFNSITGLAIGDGATFDISAADGARSFANVTGVGGSAIVLGGNSLTGTYDADSSFAGIISGSGGFTKDGAAVLTLGAANSYTGGTTISGGTLALSGAGDIGPGALSLADASAVFDISGASTDRAVTSLSGVSGSTVALGGNSLDVANASDTEFAGAFSGTGGVTKSGAGQLALSGDSTATGALAVNGGALLLNGSYAGDASVASGASFAGDGSLAGNLSVADNARLEIGDGGVGTLTLGGLVLSADSVLAYDLGAPDTAGVSDLVTISGDLTLDGQLEASDAGGFGAGVYRLIDVSGAITNNDLSISSLPSGFANAQGTIQVLQADGQVNLVVSNDLPGVLFWDGAGAIDDSLIAGGSGSWDNLLENWTNEDGSNNTSWLGGFAVFRGAAGTVTVDGDIGLTGMQFMTSGYEIANGTGGIAISEAETSIRVDPSVVATISADLAGSGGILKQDSGTLILSGSNSYTGTTQVAGGELELQGGAAIADAAAVALADGTILRVSDAETVGGVSGDGDIILDAGLVAGGDDGDGTLGGDISGSGSFTKDGAGTYVLTGTNSHSGGTTVAGGILRAGSDSAFGAGSLGVLSGATADIDGSSVTVAGLSGTGDVLLGSNGALTVDSAGGNSFDGGIAGSGQLHATGGGTLELGGASSFTGSAAIDGGTTLALVDGGDIAGAAVSLAGSGSSFDISGADGDRAVTGLASAAGTSVLLGTNDLAVTVATDSEVQGIISGSGNLVKSGGATLTLAGANDLTGTVDITAGSLDLTGSTAGDVVLRDGTSLAGAGTIGGVLTVGNASVAPGNEGVGTLTTGGLVLSSGSVLEFDFGVPDVLAASDRIQVNGDLTLDGTLNGSNAGDYGIGVYRVIDYTGTLTDNGLDLGNLPATNPASIGEVQTSVAGQVNLVLAEAIPDIQFWDGANLTGNGAIEGGSGSWNLTSTNWTGSDGSNNNPWNGKFAVFAGEASTVTVDDAITLEGMQFMTDGYVIVDGTGSLAITGDQLAIRADEGVSATISEGISGDGGILKTDLGTVELAGANSFGGDVEIAFGTLRVSGGSAIGDTLSVSVADGATFAVAADESIGDVAGAGDILLDGATLTTGGTNASTSVSGDISGSGGLAKAGSGTLTLSGSNSYTGDTDVQGGTLAGSIGSGDLNVAAGATFDLGGSNAAVAGLSGNGSILLGSNALSAGGAADTTFGGVISGTGDFTKTGAGTLTLTGANSYTGDTNISDGLLVVNGSLASQVTIAGDGALGGSGTTGGLQVNGTIAPGHSIGALNVAGDLNFAAGSTYAVEILPDGSSDLINATGNVSIDGGTVEVAAGGIDYANYTQYTIITAGSVSGSFDGVNADLAFLDTSLAYNSNSVLLDVVRNDVSFASVAGTPNGAAVAGAVQSAGLGNPLFDTVVNLDAGTAAASFDALSGEIGAAVLGELNHAASIDRLPVEARLADPLVQGVSIWGEAGVVRRELGARGGYSGYDGDRRFAAIGIDFGLGDNGRIGIAHVYSESDFEMPGAFGKANMTMASVFGYGGFAMGNASLSLGAGYSWITANTQRNIAVGALADNLSAREKGDSRQFFGELAYDLGGDALTLEPFVGVAHVSTRLDGTSEQGGAAALTFAAAKQDSTMADGGVRMSVPVGKGYSLGGELALEHYFENARALRTASFASGGSSFTIGSRLMSEDVVRLQLGSIAEFGGGLVGFDFVSRFAGGESEYGGRLRISLGF